MPWWIPAAIIGSAVAGDRASSRAADVQQSANQAGIAEQRRQFNTILDLTQPQRDVGNQALNVLAQMFGLPGSPQTTIQPDGTTNAVDDIRRLWPDIRSAANFDDINFDALGLPGGPGTPTPATPTTAPSQGFSLDNIPGTRFLIDETMRSITNAGSRSPGGNVLAALADRVSGLAGDRVFNSLFQLAGFGPQATGVAAAGAGQAGTNIASLLNASGLANASGITDRASNMNNALAAILASREAGLWGGGGRGGDFPGGIF